MRHRGDVRQVAVSGCPLPRRRRKAEHASHSDATFERAVGHQNGKTEGGHEAKGKPRGAHRAAEEHQRERDERRDGGGLEDGAFIALHGRSGQRRGAIDGDERARWARAHAGGPVASSSAQIALDGDVRAGAGLGALAAGPRRQGKVVPGAGLRAAAASGAELGTDIDASVFAPLDRSRWAGRQARGRSAVLAARSEDRRDMTASDTMGPARRIRLKPST